MTSFLNKDLLFLIMQVLDEEKYKETVHMLEQESGLFFNSKYFEELVLEGKWDEVERYLSGFTKVDDNRFSMKAFFEIRKQKYLEALDRNDRATAVDILCNDLKVFAQYNEEIYKEITRLIGLQNFRENAQLSNYRDTHTARTHLLTEVKKLIEANPVFSDKLLFPDVNGSRLRMLLNQSLNWQHSLCINPKPDPDMKTLFVDHTCQFSRDPFAQATSSKQPVGPAQKADNFLAVGAHPLSSPPQTPLSSWTPFSSNVPHPLIPVEGNSFGDSIGPATMSKSPAESSSTIKAKGSRMSDRMLLRGTGHGQSQSSSLNASNEIPNIVARTLLQLSAATSMDFHPIKHTVLLVGTRVGDFSLWDVSSGEKFFSRIFQIWDIGSCSVTFKTDLIKNPSMSIKRILWSPDGALLGVAYSKHLVQLFTYIGLRDVREHVEIDAHVGSVNDLAFAYPFNQLSVITCGDDKTVKVWDAATGAILFLFEGHDSPVYSICPQSKENIHFVFSTSVDGKIKAWLYDMMGSVVEYDTPGGSCAALAYSANGERLFSCGTNKEGESHIVEWNEKEGTLKKIYQGFTKRSAGIVQFDTSRNKFLAVGDDYSIKFWDMDNTNLLTKINAEGGLPASPRVRFNKDGTLLAISATDNKIKILATVDRLRMMRSNESQSLISSRIAAKTLPMIGSSRNIEEGQPGTEEVNLMNNQWKLTQITEPSQCQLLRLTPKVKIDKLMQVASLKYNNTGVGILILASDAIHNMWKWMGGVPNSSVRATTKFNPQPVLKPSDVVMQNSLVGAEHDQALSCVAFSKNDSYLVSLSGGKVSLYNLLTYKCMAKFMGPPPAATCVAFLPRDNNIIAVGMDDATILIYNVRTDQVHNKLRGHSKRVTGLAFSHKLNTLVSSGADSKLIVWNSASWEMEKSTFMLVPPGNSTMPNTQVEFHLDQIHFLAVNETQLSIYDSMKLECRKQWFVGEYWAPISHATFSCDGQLVYSSFVDGTVRMFRASALQIQCQIISSAYLLPSDISSTPLIYPLAIAAHPQVPNQFAIALNNGEVIVLEPLDSEGKWGVPPPEQPQG